MEKRIFQEGEKGRAPHPNMGRLVPITFTVVPEYATVDGWVVRNVLVGVCDETGEILAVPPQSTPAIKAARLAYEAEYHREPLRA